MRFRNFLLEYLTDEQRAEYSKHELSPKGESLTRKLFGDKNEVYEDLEGYTPNKSEVHNRVERHLMRPLSIEDYVSGLTTDQYGRKIKIGRLIKDPILLNDFSQDSTRVGARRASGNLRVRLVRGIEVAGQTNDQPNEKHPKGHSWAQESCKNITSGIFNDVLPSEIRGGTVVGFVEDHNGSEIYRATLQPRTAEGEPSKNIYTLEGEYGIKHPAFTKHMLGVAQRLSQPLQPSEKDKLYTHHTGGLYYENGFHALHNDLTSEDLHTILDRRISSEHDKAVLAHHNRNVTHLKKAIEHPDWTVRQLVASDPNADSQIIHKALGDTDANVAIDALHNKNAKLEHIERGLQSRYPSVKAAALTRPQLPAHRISQILDTTNTKVHELWHAAALNPNITEEDIVRGLEHPLRSVRAAFAANRNMGRKSLAAALKDDSSSVVVAALRNDVATDHDITHAIKTLPPEKVEDIFHHISGNKIKQHHIDIGVAHPSPLVRAAVVYHPSTTMDHLNTLAKDRNFEVQTEAQKWINHKKSRAS